MRRHEIEHLIRAAGAITQSNEIIIIGSQSILGSYPEAPDALLQSREADLIPVQYPERTDLIDGVLGELSPFDETFGYYADIVLRHSEHPPSPTPSPARGAGATKRAVDPGQLSGVLEVGIIAGGVIYANNNWPVFDFADRRLLGVISLILSALKKN